MSDGYSDDEFETDPGTTGVRSTLKKLASKQNVRDTASSSSTSSSRAKQSALSSLQAASEKAYPAEKKGSSTVGSRRGDDDDDDYNDDDEFKDVDTGVALSKMIVDTNNRFVSFQ